MKKSKLQAAIRTMFQAQKALHTSFPKKPFTPDGRMIGDIGEAIAEIDYRVTIDSKLRKDWDGVRENSAVKHPEVQVKATQKNQTYLRKPPHEGSLLVFKIFTDGHWECFYNGKISQVWNYLVNKKPDSTGAKFIALDELMKFKTSKKEKIPLRKKNGKL